MMDKRCFLGFDTSCYTTSVACVDGEGIVLDERAVLSVPLGGRGLRQSDALFQHNRNLPVLLERLFRAVGDRQVAAVAYSAAPTAAPGSYMPVFLAGRLVAAAAAGALGVPLLPVTHQAGHLRAALFGNEPLLAGGTLLAVHLSGGTTDLLRVELRGGYIGEIVRLGGSGDLHAGQLVDRVGVAAGLPFPCGRALEALARQAKDRSIRIPASVRGLDCSLSGAETRAQHLLAGGVPPADVAYAVYDCIARTLAKLLSAVAGESGCGTVLLSGGVASSALLRELLAARIAPDVRLYFGRSELSSDNAVGVALLAADGEGGDPRG